MGIAVGLGYLRLELDLGLLPTRGREETQYSVNPVYSAMIVGSGRDKRRRDHLKGGGEKV